MNIDKLESNKKADLKAEKNDGYSFHEKYIPHFQVEGYSGGQKKIVKIFI